MGMRAARLVLALALAFLAHSTYASEACDCHNLLLTPAPVCGANRVTFINRCVAECQGAEVARDGPCEAGGSLSLKAAAANEGPSAATAQKVAVFDLSKVDVAAIVDEAVLSRFARQGFSFSAKVEMKRGLVPEARVLSNSAGSAEPSAADADGSVLTARLTKEGHLYLRSTDRSSTLGGHKAHKRASLLPGLPKGAEEAASAAAAASTAAAPRRSRKALASPSSTGGRKMLLSGLGSSSSSSSSSSDSEDDREEQSTTQYPHSAVGLITFDTPDGRSICTGTLISARHVLTAGHCVYDTVGREYYDLSDMFFYPNAHSGETPERKVGVRDAVTEFMRAGPGSECGPEGRQRCQSTADFQYDWAVLTLEEDVGEEYGWLGVGYECGRVEYDPVTTAGYPGDLQRSSDEFWGARMFGMEGKLDEFDACGSSLSDALVGSTLDSAGGQSGSGVWGSSDYIIRAMVNASGPDESDPFSTYHRTISDAIFGQVVEVLESEE